MVGVVAGMVGSSFLLYFAAKTMPGRFERWRWMPVGGRARLAGELQVQRARSEALQNERDQRRVQNRQFIAHTADRTVRERRCAQWSSGIALRNEELKYFASGPATDGTEPSSVDVFVRSSHSMVEGDHENIEALIQELQGLHAQVPQNCNFARGPSASASHGPGYTGEHPWSAVVVLPCDVSSGASGGRCPAKSASLSAWPQCGQPGRSFRRLESRRIDRLMALMNTVTPVNGQAMFDMHLPRRGHAPMHSIPALIASNACLPHWLPPPHAMI